MQGYVPLRRGIIEHFKVMSSSEVKVYIGILLLANYKTAEVKITLAELVDTISLDKKIIINSLHRLDKFGYVKYTPAKNQWHSNIIKIINYNGRVKNTLPTTPPTPLPTPPPTTLAKDITSNKGKGLQNPNNYKEVLKNKYKYLKEETFVGLYGNYLEMRKKIHRPATEKAEDLALDKLHKHPLETAIKMLEQSILNSWQGIFPLKTEQFMQSRNSTSFNLTNEAIEKTLGKIATKEMIKNFLRDLPQSLWPRVSSFLGRRFPEDGDRAYTQAEREVLSEIRQIQDKLNPLIGKIGNE